MATKRSVILRGCPIVNEVGVASATVKPGHLVKGVSSISHQTATTSGKFPAAFALERDELGKGIDDSLEGAGGASAYAAGDTVKVAVFAPGDQVTAFVASGENITEDDLLESNGDGTLSEGSTNPIARALETLGAVTTLTAVRVEIL